MSKRMIEAWAAALVLGLVAACGDERGGSAAAPDELGGGDEGPRTAARLGVPEAEEGSILLRTLWKGPPFEAMDPLKIPASRTEGCCPEDELVDDTNRVLEVDGEGGVANVLFELHHADGRPAALDAEPASVEVRRCRFEPRVTAYRRGEPVLFRNVDLVSHQLGVLDSGDGPVAKRLPAEGEWSFLPEGEIPKRVHCKKHPWMGAVLVPVDGGVRRSSAEGVAEFTHLVPGRYRVSWWHEEIGSGVLEEVEVVAGEEVAVEVELGEIVDLTGGVRR